MDGERCKESNAIGMRAERDLHQSMGSFKSERVKNIVEKITTSASNR
jgi:hypothetical protein